jgi:hypothetical protein
MFCTDTDLLYWEPNIFRDAAFASQLMLAGTGDLAGINFNLDTGNLTTAQVAPNHVIVLTGAIAGSYPIISIQSATLLTLSVMHDSLFPESGPTAPAPVGTAVDLAYAIRTFYPQRKVVSDLLSRAAGVGPDTDLEGAAIVNAAALRRPCVLGALQMIYNALAAPADAPTEHQIRAELYQRLYRRALDQVKVEIDANNDGKPDLTRRLTILEPRRI